MDDEETGIYVAAERAPDAKTALACQQLHHWKAEAIDLISGRAHWQILRRSCLPEFRADSRWLAEQIGVSPDQVNVALSRLLRLGLLRITAPNKWKDVTGISNLTESAFRKLALARIRESAGPLGVASHKK